MLCAQCYFWKRRGGNICFYKYPATYKRGLGVLPVLLWYRSCFSPCQVSLLFDYCSLPNVSQLLLVACPVCVWYLSPCLSFVPCRIILVCGELCPVCYLCSRCSLCYPRNPHPPCSLPFELINYPFTRTVLPACLPPANRERSLWFTIYRSIYSKDPKTKNGCITVSFILLLIVQHFSVGI